MGVVRRAHIVDDVLPIGDGGTLVKFALALVVVDFDSKATGDDAFDEVDGAFVIHHESIVYVLAQHTHSL